MIPKKNGQLHDSLQVVQGNVLNRTSVEQAVKGRDAVNCTLGLPAVMDNTKIRTNGTKNIIGAMEKAGVKRLICQSALGIGDSFHILPFHYKYLVVPLMLRCVFADHKMQEDLIKKSTLDWIIVRPGNLTDGEHTGTYQHGFTENSKTLTLKISRADTADFLLKQLKYNHYLHKTPSISY